MFLVVVRWPPTTERINKCKFPPWSNVTPLLRMKRFAEKSVICPNRWNPLPKTCLRKIPATQAKWERAISIKTEKNAVHNPPDIPRNNFLLLFVQSAYYVALLRNGFNKTQLAVGRWLEFRNFIGHARGLIERVFVSFMQLINSELVIRLKA